MRPAQALSPAQLLSLEQTPHDSPEMRDPSATAPTSPLSMESQLLRATADAVVRPILATMKLKESPCQHLVEVDRCVRKCPSGAVDPPCFAPFSSPLDSRRSCSGWNAWSSSAPRSKPVATAPSKRW